VVFDSFTPQFESIIQLAEQLITFLNDKANSNIAQFSFDCEPIIPLRFVGLNCRVSAIRKRAIQLLYGIPQREGVCDSLFAAKAADWVRQIEERHMNTTTGEVPEWARVTNFRMILNSANKSAELVCKQNKTTNDFGLVETEMRTLVSW
jgi:hypothetical protein